MAPSHQRERRDDTCRDDVSFAYRFFLGRDAESSAVCDLKVGLGWRQFVVEFISSPEFLVRVRDRILGLEIPHGGLFDRPPDADLRRWVADRMPLQETGRALVVAAESWADMHWCVFSDEVFSLTISPAPTLRFPFLKHLEVLRSTQKAKREVASQSSRPIWVLVTGAPRSGTSLLRAMLAEHPNVALLQEYGLTRLVDGIDAILGRPSIQRPDWNVAGMASDLAFAEVASFYRDQPGQEFEKFSDGVLSTRSFDSIASAILSTLVPKADLRVVGDKMPIAEQWEDIPRLFSRLPGFKILIVMRNPGEVISSSLNRRAATERGRDNWPIRSVEEAAAQWTEAWHLSRNLKSRYDGLVHLLKYEDLCADTENTMAEVYAFLGLPGHRPDTRVKVRPTELSLLTPAESEKAGRLLGEIMQAWPFSSCQALLTNYAGLPTPYVFGRTIRLNKENAEAYLTMGFSAPEPSGRWAEGPVSRMEIHHGETTGILLTELWISKAAVGKEGTCNVVIRPDCGAPSLFRFSVDGGRAAIVTRACMAREPGLLILDLLAAEPRYIDGNARTVGVCVETFRVTHIA